MILGRSWFWYMLAVAIAIGILLLSTVFSVPFQIEGISYLDKWEHTFAYFALSFSFLHAFWKAGKLSAKTTLLIILFAVLYGLLLEFVQFTFFPDRYFEWVDALANSLGSLLGLFAFKGIRHYGKSL